MDVQTFISSVTDRLTQIWDIGKKKKKKNQTTYSKPSHKNKLKISDS